MASVQFADADEPLSDEDAQSLLDVIRLGNAEGDEVLIWARAREPGLLGEASRRAEVILRLAAREGAVAVTRVTTSPAVREVEIEVSATRERLGDAGGDPAAGDDPMPVGGDGAEGTWSALRAAARRYRPAVASCLRQGAEGRWRRSGDAVVRLAVDSEGAVAAALRRDSPLWRPSVDTCLASGARAWRFPRSGGGYVIDVPVRVGVKAVAPR
jgi:hypothetical protein